MSGDPSIWTLQELANATVWWRTHGSALENVVRGHMELELAEYLQAQFDALLAQQGEVTAFHDWSEAPSYASQYRASWQSWLRKQTRVRHVHFFVRSTILKMGVTVANLAYTRTNFVVHSKRADYERARLEHMPYAAPPLEPR